MCICPGLATLPGEQPSAASWGSDKENSHSDAASARTQHTLFKSTFSCTDERDFIGIDHVMCSILQHKPEPRELVTRQRTFLTGIQKPLLMNEHSFWGEWISLTDALPRTPKDFSIQKFNIFMYVIFHSSKKVLTTWTALLFKFYYCGI